jgi:prepilin-type N-terminal cleavage/methylation domain-containing protein
MKSQANYMVSKFKRTKIQSIYLQKCRLLNLGVRWRTGEGEEHRMIEKLFSYLQSIGLNFRFFAGTPQSGVSLIEFLMVIVIIGIIAGISIVNINLTSSKVKAAAYNLRSNLLLARSMAVKRNTAVTVNFDPSTESYNGTVNGEILFQTTLEQPLDLDTSNLSITFTPLGTATNSRFYIKSSKGDCNIVVRSSGRVYIDGNCPG